MEALFVGTPFHHSYRSTMLKVLPRTESRNSHASEMAIEIAWLRFYNGIPERKRKCSNKCGVVPNGGRYVLSSLYPLPPLFGLTLFVQNMLVAKILKDMKFRILKSPAKI